MDRLTLGLSSSSPRSLLIPSRLPLLLLTGCHVFADGSIPCTRDELPCNEADADADSDADTDTDTDADADTDTDADADPVLGAIYVARTGSSHEMVVLDSALQEVASQSITVALNGPIAWRPSDSTVLTALDESLYTMSRGTLSFVGTLDDIVTDIAPGEQFFYIATPSSLYRGSSQGFELLNTGFIELDSLFWADAAQSLLYLVDRGGAGGHPSLYSYTPGTGGFAEELAGYDTTRNRSEDGFLGPGEQPFVCSAAGGVFAIADIAAGTTVPERIATGGLTDVFDCAYDPGTDEVMIFSASRGVLRVGAGGRTSTWEDTTGSTLVGGEGW